MIGTRELAAKRSTMSCSKVRIITRSLMREITWPASSTGSPRPSCESRVLSRSPSRRAGACQPRTRGACACSLLEDHHQRAVEERVVGLVALELVLIHWRGANTYSYSSRVKSLNWR